ncbi:glycosyltransferase [Belnapia rosea]|uniref:UDP:flavonoid glycosyltransferase YjiC, YdhE family n=1 Tax=Belnapia rosea TaxID=938405 RepID=A0A1G6U491_9PROT|nr:nucleotide disphospho-sugar-binding domain-containing protein [Belnapia rosea]SDD35407.1 UDP:flavonoid glycosyltransferase YjiC, YdhE family [Belnapia rosea]
MSRILLATTGSLGDLFPYLAVAAGLRGRGHQVTIATAEGYRGRVEAAGLGFAPMRPSMPEGEPDLAAFARAMDRRTGPEFVWRTLVAEPIRDAYADLMAASEGVALILASPVAAAAPMVAECRGLPWAPAYLQPFTLFSAEDPGIPGGYDWLWRAEWLRRLAGPAIRSVARWMVGRWSRDVAAFRVELGLPAATDPILNAARPPAFSLSLFSPLLSRAEPPPTGFPFWDEPAPMPRELARFLAAGPPPLVFTLGSAAIYAPGRFFAESLEAARLLGQRAVLLTGTAANRAALGPLPPGMLAVDYLPHSALFPAASAIIHQGGIGTSAQAMRAGRPMLVVPFSHDQPDNAARLARLGIAASLPTARYRADRASKALGPLLDNPEVEARAGAIGRAIRAEDGVGAACDRVEAWLGGR